MTSRFAWLDDAAVKQLVATYHAAGYALRFVGGCVRDSLLERQVHDIDACTPCLPKEGIALLKAAGIKAIPTGIEHGTITAIVKGRPFEITTLRRDIETNGRHAKVTYTHSYEEDAARRDFTMNAIYCDAEGTLSDFHNGAQDAKAGRINFIGDANARIQEDALRILRLFRFYASHGKEGLPEDARAACTANGEMLQHLSGERVQHEMLKLLAAKQPMPALEALQDCGLYSYIFDKKQSLVSLEKCLNAERVLHKKPDAILRAAALAAHPENAQWVADRWKCSKRDAKRLVALVAQKAAPLHNVKRSIFEEGNAPTIDRFIMGFAGNKASLAQLEEAKETLLHWHAPAFPVGGKELKAHGIAEGPQMGDALAVLRERWIESDYSLDASALLASLG